MKTGLRAPISAAFAIGFGLLVLFGLFVPGFEGLRNQILNWAILLAALALLLGLVNLFQVHFHKLRAREKPLYSFMLLAALLFTFTITLLQGSQGALPTWLFNYVQVPMETSLMALLAISLTIAASRLIQQRRELMNILFIVTLFILLLGAGPLFGLELPYFTRILAPSISNFLSVGATRGLLIGVGLGTLATGLRILLGADRPYGA